MTSAVTHPPETNGGIVTSWLPITSAWPSVPECATGGIYSQLGPNGVAIADDPYYGLSINTALTCLPPFATSWWAQSTATPLLTHTSLGPIVCPGGYTTATTSAVNDISTFVACCPSNYAFKDIKDSGNIGQCNSPLSVGQVLTYVDLANLHTTSYTITAEGTSVSAVQLNGYVFAPSTTSSSSSTSSASSTSPLAGSTGSTVSPTSPQTSSKGGLSTAASVGIGVGVASGVLGTVCGLLVCWFCIRKYRRKAKTSDSSIENHGPPPPMYSGVPKVERAEMEQPTHRYELSGPLK